ncbi:DUF3052 domain-containing protein [Rhodococcus sp. NPDC019616]|uniref:DUF3052 domain-containing protein n=2 Tax=Rhodococcus TaxID=1827 RepID=UPI0033D7D083
MTALGLLTWRTTAHPAEHTTVRMMTDRPRSAPATGNRLGVHSDMLIPVFGYREDVDHELRGEIREHGGSTVTGDDLDGLADAALLWWRQPDGDLTDELLDAQTLLGPDGYLWLLTPKTGHDGFVDPSVIAEAAETVGMTLTATLDRPDWLGVRLSPPRRRP